MADALKQPRTITPRQPRSVLVTCRCGKERPVDPGKEGERVRLAEIGMCGRCEAETGMKLDLCPEYFIYDKGVSACRLTWAHTGPCEPYTPIEAILIGWLVEAMAGRPSA